MRPKTIKRLAILIAVFTLIGWTGFYGHRYQIARLARAAANEAALAEKEGDYEKAERRYREHLINLPGDVDIQLRYAAALLKGPKSPNRQMEALQIYSNILRPGRDIGREDVRRLRVDLKMEMNRLVGDGSAEDDLKILLNAEKNQTDGKLLFLMGRCSEAAKNDAKAVTYYQRAIENHAPQQIEAYQRLATVLRDGLKQPEDAGKAIKEMVQSAPDDYRVYLARGRYCLSEPDRSRRKSLLGAAKADFQKARELAPDQPEVYLEMAKAAETESRYAAARDILEAGLAKAPDAAKLYEALAGIQLRDGHGAQAIETLERSLNSPAEKGALRLLLALVLAQAGDTGKLKLQIEELKSSGYNPILVKYLEGYYYVNSKEYRKAKQILVPIEAMPGLSASFKAQINNLLAQCYSQLGEPGQDEAYRRAQKADPDDLASKLGLITRMVGDGEIEGAIKEYRALVERAPQVRLPLARLLIAKNRQRPARQRDWSEVTRLIDDAEKATPRSVEPIVLRADLYAEQGQSEEARSEINKARSRFASGVELALEETNVLAGQGRVDDALRALDLATNKVGDRVELRLQRARLLAIKQGPQMATVGRDLGQNIESFSQDDRRKLEDGLAEISRMKPPQALAELEKARARFLANSVSIWIAETNLIASQKRVDQALSLLDEAQRQLGDRVEFRLQRARLAARQPGPQVARVLTDLAQNIDSFSKAERRKLLTGLALEFSRQQDLEGASRLWSRLAEEEPNDLDARRTLLDLAFQTGNSDEIDKNIKQIQAIEGNDGLLGRSGEVRRLIWQAQRSRENDPQEAQRLRTKARALLSELMSRRENWSYIPLALAELEQQELAEREQELAKLRQEVAQGGLKEDEVQSKKDEVRSKEDEVRSKEETIIRFYRRAIDLGQRSSAVVRRTVQLLFKNRRGDEALDLLNSIPIESQLAGDMGHQASQVAVENRDFERAEEIARKNVDANPTDFQERIWLAKVLIDCGKLDKAETELKVGVDLSKTDPDRWITLVRFFVLTRQVEKAEKAIEDAEANLPQAKAPQALAQCCELLGRVYDGNSAQATTKWYDKARNWYEKLRTTQPDDLAGARSLAEFFFRTKQIDKAQAQLDAILKRGAGAESAWARRVKAVTLALSTDYRTVRSALDTFGPAVTATPGGAGALEDPEDLRALAQVLDAQKTAVHRKRAIAILESLVARNLANGADRFLLARLHEISGDWPQARDEYRDLIARTKNPRDLETFTRRPVYLAQFVDSLIQHGRSGSEQDLIEAKEYVDELTQLQPDGLSGLVYQVELGRAHNQIDKAAEGIRAFAERPNLTPAALRALANLAEKLDQFELAEQLHNRAATALGTQVGRLPLAVFLGRRGQVERALKICEPPWPNARDLGTIAVACVEVVTTATNVEPEQLKKVAGWLEQALTQAEAQKLKSATLLLIGLGNIRERQKHYDEAERLYQRAIKRGELDATPYNNLAWLMALKGGRHKDALIKINEAIDLRGPMAEFLDTRAVVYLGLDGKTQDAIDDLKDAIGLDPSAAKLFHLAQAYLKTNEKAKAKQYLQAAQEKGLPNGLHPLELTAYQKLLVDLRSP